MAYSHAFLFYEMFGGTNSEGDELNPEFLETQGSRRKSSGVPGCEAADFGAAFDPYSLSNIFECIAEAYTGKPAAVCGDTAGATGNQCAERPYRQP
jgi:hypothetical protein